MPSEGGARPKREMAGSYPSPSQHSIVTGSVTAEEEEPAATPAARSIPLRWAYGFRRLAQYTSEGSTATVWKRFAARMHATTMPSDDMASASSSLLFWPDERADGDRRERDDAEDDAHEGVEELLQEGEDEARGARCASLDERGERKGDPKGDDREEGGGAARPVEDADQVVRHHVVEQPLERDLEGS